MCIKNFPRGCGHFTLIEIWSIPEDTGQCCDCDSPITIGAFVSIYILRILSCESSAVCLTSSWCPQILDPVPDNWGPLKSSFNGQDKIVVGVVGREMPRIFIETLLKGTQSITSKTNASLFYQIIIADMIYHVHCAVNTC